MPRVERGVLEGGERANTGVVHDGVERDSGELRGGGVDRGIIEQVEQQRLDVTGVACGRVS